MMVNKLFVVGFTLMCFGISSYEYARSAEPFFDQRHVFVGGTNGYHAFRRPAVVVTNEGTVLAFCQAHRYDTSENGEIDVVLRRSSDGGMTWQDLQIIYNEGPDSCTNPTAVVDRDTGTIWVLMRWNGYPDTLADILAGRKLTHTPEYRADLRLSNDDGATWHALASMEFVTEMFKKPEWRLFVPGPGTGIQIKRGPQKGRLVFPCALSAFGKDAGYEGFQDIHTIHDHVHFGSYVVFSDDHGKSWKRSAEVVWPWMGECQVVELVDGRLMLNMQTYFRKQKCRAVAISEDGGNTWSEATFDESMVDPVSGGSVLRFTRRDTDDRDRLLFSNLAHPDKSANLTVRLSYNEGHIWPVAKVIESGPAGYSCLTVLPDKSIGLLYEQKTLQRISFARFNLDWLTDGKDTLPDVPQGGLKPFRR